MVVEHIPVLLAVTCWNKVAIPLGDTDQSNGSLFYISDLRDEEQGVDHTSAINFCKSAGLHRGAFQYIWQHWD